MGLQLVADYRNLKKLVDAEVINALLSENVRWHFNGWDLMTACNALELAWVADCIESCTLLSVRVESNPAILRAINEMDKSNLLRGRLFRLITSCGYHHVPEGELRIEIRPTGLYLYS